jgi:hypothetical protein
MLDANRLGAALKAAIDSAPDKQNRLDVFTRFAQAIITEVQGHADISSFAVPDPQGGTVVIVKAAPVIQ